MVQQRTLQLNKISHWLIVFAAFNLTGLVFIVLYATSAVPQCKTPDSPLIASESVTDIDFTDVWYPNISALGDTLKSIPARINLTNNHIYDQVIPRNIYQTWINNSFAGPLMKQAVYSWIHLNPEYNYYFFNDQDCEQWIAKYCGQRYLAAYLNINSAYGAARCDYFRYLLMWKWGGIYVDIDSSLRHPFRKWIQPTDEFVTGSGHDVPNQFMLIAKPNHIVYRRAALHLTEKLERHEPLPRGGVIDFSGPKILRRIYIDVLKETTTKNREDKEPFSVRKIPQSAIHANVGGNVYFKHYSKLINKEMSRVKTRYNDINIRKVPFYVNSTQP